jgi:hypothetical protein
VLLPEKSERERLDGGYISDKEREIDRGTRIRAGRVEKVGGKKVVLLRRRTG